MSDESDSAWPDLPEAVLVRMGLTPAQWARMSEQVAERELRAPKVGDRAPGFDLPYLDDRSRRARLSDFRGQPVGLIFGSYT